MDRPLPRRIVLATLAASAGAIRRGAHGEIAAATSDRHRNGGGAERSGAAENRKGGVLMAPQTSKDLWQPWVALWNGDLAVADRIIAPGFVAHFAPAGGSPAEVRGPEGLKGWIAGATAVFAGHSFTTTVGPLADGDLVAGRWVFRATYQGGIPGASPDAVGRRVEYAGMDLFRVEAGRIAEYWLCADIMQLLQQVGVIPS